MTEIISIYNVKGGVGKSTLAILLSHSIAAHNLKILLIDLDDQANLSTAFLGDYDENAGSSVLDLLDGDKEMAGPIAYSEQISIFPVHSSVKDFDSENRLLKTMNTMRKKLRLIKDDYDYVFIDTPGSYNARVSTALSVSNYVLIPTILDHLAIQVLMTSTTELLTQVVEGVNDDCKILGIVPMRVSGTRYGAPFEVAERRYYKMLTDTFGDLVWPMIPRRKAFALDPGYTAISVFDQKPVDANAVNDAKTVCDKFLEALK